MAIFKEVGYQDLNKIFLWYFFTRIERFFCEGTKREMQDSLENLVRNTGHVNGYHVEHILSNNDENRQLFDNDPEQFERERNRLGGLLLLRGRDNQSSRNEPYSKKLASYSGTLLWNQSLREDFYKSKKDHTDLVMRYQLKLRPFEVFDRTALESRSETLFDLTQLVWS